MSMDKNYEQVVKFNLCRWKGPKGKYIDETHLYWIYLNLNICCVYRMNLICIKMFMNVFKRHQREKNPGWTHLLATQNSGAGAFLNISCLSYLITYLCKDNINQRSGPKYLVFKNYFEICWTFATFAFFHFYVTLINFFTLSSWVIYKWIKS